MRVPLGPVIGRYPSSSTSESDGQMGGGAGGGVIRHNRKCRDVAFLIFFIAFWIAMIVNSSFGFNQGNPLRLTHGFDFKGNVCGDKRAKPNLHGFELRYWLNPNQVYLSGLKDSLNNLEDAKSVCVKNCPSTSEDTLKWVCVYPEGDIHLSMKEWVHRDYDYFDFLTPEMRNASLQLLGPCYPVLFPSVNVYWSCQFIARVSNVSLQHWQQIGGAPIHENMLIDKSNHKSINSRSSVLERYIADIEKAWPVLIVCGGIVPLFLSVIWLLMIRYFTAAMAWITVFIFNILMISVTMLYYIKATAVMVIALEGHVEAFRLLVYVGADVKLSNKSGETAIGLSKFCLNCDLFEKVMLEFALEKGNHNGGEFHADDMNNPFSALQ